MIGYLRRFRLPMVMIAPIFHQRFVIRTSGESGGDDYQFCSSALSPPPTYIEMDTIAGTSTGREY